jgi:flagellar hook-basal body complex protein FliE
MSIIGKGLPVPVPGTSLADALPKLSPGLNGGSSAGVTEANFTGRLASAIEDVASAQNNAASLTQAYEMGQEQDLAKVMVSQQISSLGFHLTMNVRNKVLSAYKDIMNMPV